jgi:hypothetical protein
MNNVVGRAAHVQHPVEFRTGALGQGMFAPKASVAAYTGGEVQPPGPGQHAGVDRLHAANAQVTEAEG